MLLKKGLPSLGKDTASIATDLKSAKWKIMLPALLKQKIIPLLIILDPIILRSGISATNVWISGELRMGTPDAVSRYVSEFKSNGGNRTKEYETLTTKVMK
jgi:hypothetical protein